MPDAGVTLPPGAPGLGTLLADKYRLDGILGIGGMGVVYRSNHALLGVPVAVKIILPEYAARREFVTRFTNEARAAARIQSDNIARVSDVGTTNDGISFLVMELLDGEDLGNILAREGPQPPERCVDWMLQAIAGLSDAHSAGIIHRDLKPSNLFLVRRKGKADRIKLCDFGISKGAFEDPSSHITKTNTMLGSPAYMAPEQLRSSRTVDARADIWSLGIILYELLTGSTPFIGENVGAVFAAILETDPLPVRSMLPAIPEALDAAILRCLRRSPAERFPTAAELGVALAPFASDGGQEVLRRMSGRPSAMSGSGQQGGDVALQRTTPHYDSSGNPRFRSPLSDSSGSGLLPGIPTTTPNPAPGIQQTQRLSDPNTPPPSARNGPLVAMGMAPPAPQVAGPRRGLAIAFALSSFVLLTIGIVAIVRFAGGATKANTTTTTTGIVATTVPTESASVATSSSAPVVVVPTTTAAATSSSSSSAQPRVIYVGPAPAKRNPTAPTTAASAVASSVAPTPPPPVTAAATTSAAPTAAGPSIYTDPWKKN